MQPRALVTVPADAPLDALIDGLRAALDGHGPAIAPLGPSPAPGADPDEVPGEVALALRTSGSTGTPRLVLLDAAAIRASGEATHARLGGPGRWVLALPRHHVAGMQVLARSLLAGEAPVALPPGHFDPVAAADVLRAARREAGVPLYASLVPTQVHRLVAAAADGALPAELRPWTRLDAILVGGAAAGPGLLARATDLGLPVVTTYGMTETAGGCVYDGVPLDGVRVRVVGAAEGASAGVVQIAGPVLARGYVPADASAFVVADGVRWFRTSDLGEVRGGVLHVVGRADDVVVSGGVNVAPAAVEAVLGELGVHACVVGLPDDEWGQVVAAAVLGTVEVDLDRLRDAVAERLGRAAAPRVVVVTDAFPLRGPGKVDRAALAAEIARLVGRSGPAGPTGSAGPVGPVGRSG